MTCTSSLPRAAGLDAQAGDETVTVLALEGNEYVEHGVFAPCDTTTSPLLAGFAVDVTALFDAPRPGA